MTFLDLRNSFNATMLICAGPEYSRAEHRKPMRDARYVQLASQSLSDTLSGVELTTSSGAVKIDNFSDVLAQEIPQISEFSADYARLFDNAFVPMAQLTALSKEDMLHLGIPLGHALLIFEAAERIVTSGTCFFSGSNPLDTSPSSSITPT